jgi:hypothetical protein
MNLCPYNVFDFLFYYLKEKCRSHYQFWYKIGSNIEGEAGNPSIGLLALLSWKNTFKWTLKDSQ